MTNEDEVKIMQDLNHTPKYILYQRKYFKNLKSRHLCYDCRQPTEQKPNGNYYVRCKACRIIRANYAFERWHKNDS